MNSTLSLKYVPNAYTDEEGEIEIIAEFALKNIPDTSCFSMPRTEIELPNGEKVSVICEITDYGSNFSARSENKRLCGLKSDGMFNVSFLTPKGLELYAAYCPNAR